MEQRIIDNRYEIVNNLGQGLWGEVFEVLDLTNQKTKALKIMTACSSEEAIEQVFREEFRRLVKLRHAHVIRVYDFGFATPTVPYYTMEFMPEGFLSLDGMPYNESLVLEIFGRLCLGLQFIHSHGVLHGDIKPENILFRSNPHARRQEQKPVEIVLSDFSVSGLLAAQHEEGDNRHNPVLGSLPYIAPEVLLHRRADYRSDLFSLGVVLYRLVTGYLPFGGKSPGEMITSVLSSKPLPPSRHNNRISEQCEFIILRLLEKEPLKRFHSARDILNVLAGIPDPPLKQMLFEKTELAVLSEKFVGREEQLGMIRDMLDKTREGQGQTLLLYGETGIGKSRLVQEIRTIAQLSGSRVVQIDGSGDSAFMTPFRRILLELGYRQRTMGLALPPGFQERLDDLLSEEHLEMTGIRTPDDLREKTDEKDVTLLFDAMFRFLERIMIPLLHPDSRQVALPSRMIESESILLVVEDIQRADRTLISFFDYLTRNNSDLPLMLIATFRDDEIVFDSGKAVLPTMALLQQAEKTAHAHAIRLPRFSLEESSRLITSFLEIAARPGGFVRQLHDMTAGNPLHIMELLRYLLENNILSFEQGNWWIADKEAFQTIPANLRAILERRYERLSELQKSILQRAAFFDYGFSLTELAELTARDRLVLQDIMDDLTRWHMIVRTAEKGTMIYRFAHRHFRSLVLDQVKPNDRAELHLKTGGILGKRFLDGDMSRATTIIDHFRKGGDISTAFQLAVQAATLSKNRGNPSEALEFYETARSVISKDATPEDRLDLEEKTGDCAFSADRYDHAEMRYNDALAMVDGSTGKEATIRLLLKKGLVSETRGDFKGALAQYREALAFFGGDYTNVEALPVLKHLASVLSWTKEFSAAGDMSRAGLKLARQLEQPADEAYLLNILGRIAEDSGSLDRAREFFSKALELYDQLGDQGGLQRIYNNLGIHSDKRGDWHRAIEYHRNALEIRRTSGNLSGEADSLTNMSAAHGMRGDWKEAFAFAHQALDIYRRLGQIDGQATVHHNLGELLYRKGDYTEAQKHLRTACDLKESVGDNAGVASSCLTLASVSLRQNELESAMELCLRSQKILRKTGMQRHLAVSYRILAEIYLAQGNYSYSLREVNRGRRIIEAVGDIVEHGNILRVYGDISHQMGDQTTARQSFDESLRLLEGAGATYDIGVTCLEMGARYLTSNNIKEAGLLLDRAKQIFEELRSHDCLRRVDEARSELQARVQPYYISLPTDHEHLKSLIRVSHMVNSIRDLDTLLEKVLDIIISTVKADRGAIFLKESSSNDLVPYLIRNLENETVFDAVQLSRTVAESVARHGEPIYITDTRGDSLSSGSRSVSLYGIIAILCVPLKVYDDLIGVVYLDSRSLADIFLEQDISFVRAFSSMAAQAIANGIDRERLIREGNYYRIQSSEFYREQNFVAHSKAMRTVLKTVAKVASSSSTVLISGDSGTGKEMVARLVHTMGSRSEKLFIPYFCGNAPESLIDSELFGHVKGAFTGAESAKKGIFEEANGGTVFLDEISEIGLQVQAKLLRFLQEREIKPLGSTRIIKVDVRIIAATNRTIEEEVRKGRFREDLLYRLNVIRLELPPLRDRKEDIPPLVTHFVEKYNHILGKKVAGVSQRAMERLIDYSWPGNIRELENQIELAINLVEDENLIDESLLRDEIRNIDNIMQGKRISGKLKDILAHVERELIVNALMETKGNKSKAARRLGLSRQALNQKLKTLNIF